MAGNEILGDRLHSPLRTCQSPHVDIGAHGIWFKQVGNINYRDQIQQGHVIVTDTGGAREVGFWGSANSLNMTAAGAVGIIADGSCRDTDELILQKTPICSRARGRTIIPGRIQVVEVQALLAVLAFRCVLAISLAVTVMT